MRNSLLIFLFIPFLVFSQRNVKDSIIGTPLIGVHYGANWTGGDLVNRYGFLNHIGGMMGYKTAKNWFLGFDGNFIFGNNIKVLGLFDHLVDSYNNITATAGDPAKVVLYVRGFNVNVAFGKIIPVFSPNKNSGILIQGGIGYLLHKIRIETQDQVVPSIELDYRKGYDRLAIGVNFHQFIGYSFMSNAGLRNFYAGFYLQEGLTRNQRTINFDEPDVPVSTDLRLDIQGGFRLGWYIPFYKRQPKEYYYN
jgi:hypothetical protein